MKKLVFLFAFTFFSNFIFANGLNITGVSYDGSNNTLDCTVSWDNSWYDTSGSVPMYDGVWLFVKYAPSGGDNWHHADITSVTSSEYSIVSADDKGVMVWDNSTHASSTVTMTVSIELSPLVGSFYDFKIFGMEMVYVPEGPFYAGDGYSEETFHMNGDTLTPLHITSSAQINYGTGAGQYGKGTAPFDINANYPKGYKAFWVMKYKITAEQYVDFLNCLSRIQQNNRVNADISGSEVVNHYVMSNHSVFTSNPIRCDNIIGTGVVEFYCDLNQNGMPNEIDDGQDRALNYLSPLDLFAFLDWASLRPYSELEYEKLCRGPLFPVAGEYPWGSTVLNVPGQTINIGQANETYSNVGVLEGIYNHSSGSSLRVGATATANSSRKLASATYYGVMDIANKNEFLISIVDITFYGANNYGDGLLNTLGFSDIENWLFYPVIRVSEKSAPIAKHKISVSTNHFRSGSWGGRGVRSINF